MPTPGSMILDRSRGVVAGRVSDLALLLLAFSLFLAPAGVAAALILLWIGFIGQLAAHWPGLRGAMHGLTHSHPVVWITALFVLYCLAQWIVLRLLPTTGPPPDLGTTLDWARISVFAPAAYAVASRPARLPLLLLLALTGLLGGMLLRLDWTLLLTDVGTFLETRTGFGFGTIAFGLFSATALLGLILLRALCWRDGSGRLRWWRLGGWGVATVLVLQGLVMSESRGTWLAFLIALAVGLWLQSRHRARLRSVGGATSYPRLAAAAAAAVLIGLAVVNAERLSERALEEVDTLQAIATTQSVPASEASLSWRWHAQLVGARLVVERPWFGWGAGTSRALMSASGEPGVVYKDGGVLKHLHNTYLQTAVELGLIGLTIFVAIHIGLITTLWRRLRAVAGDRRASSDLPAFLLAALVLLIVWDLFDYRVIRQDWRGYWTLLAGAALGTGLRPLQTHPPEPELRPSLGRPAGAGDTMNPSLGA